MSPAMRQNASKSSQITEKSAFFRFLGLFFRIFPKMATTVRQNGLG
jgi:hypothetical protein